MDTKTDGPPWVRRRHGMKPSGSAGVPPAHILAQSRPSAPSGSSGDEAMAPLRPGPCGSLQQSGWLRHCRKTERQENGEDAGLPPATERSIEKDYQLNMDAQDYRDGTLLHDLQSLSCKILLINNLLSTSPLQSPH